MIKLVYLQQIKDSISILTKYDNWYWVKVSGSIEYLFEHMNGYPIPNVYGEEVLLNTTIHELHRFYRK